VSGRSAQCVDARRNRIGLLLRGLAAAREAELDVRQAGTTLWVVTIFVLLGVL